MLPHSESPVGSASPLRVCVLGVGAIGGLIAAKLAAAGHPVTGIARGAQLDAIRDRGLVLLGNNVTLRPRINATSDLREAGPQDVVFVTLKSHQLPSVAAEFDALLDSDTVVITACNGFPWWYFHCAGIKAPAHLDSVDPGARIWRAIGPERAMGCVVYPAARVATPGTIQHIFGERFALGEPDGSMSARLSRVVNLMRAAGFDPQPTGDIRTEVWIKLMANVAYNPLSLVSGKTLGQMIDDQQTATLLAAIMTEVSDVALAMGIEVPIEPAVLMAATRPLGDHKTSMLQDFEAGRSVELTALTGPVLELAEYYGVSTPMLDTIATSARQKIGN